MPLYMVSVSGPLTAFDLIVQSVDSYWEMNYLLTHPLDSSSITSQYIDLSITVDFSSSFTWTPAVIPSNASALYVTYDQGLTPPVGWDNSYGGTLCRSFLRLRDI
jgi:hypothetical protein